MMDDDDMEEGLNLKVNHIDEEANEEEMRSVTCICSAVLGLPVSITVFQCGVCKGVMEAPPVLNEENIEILRTRALNHFVVREAVSKELDDWLDGKETFTPESSSIVARFYRKLLEFPLFQDKSTGIENGLLDFFKFLPKVEEKLCKMGSNRKGVRSRFVRMISGPIYYATFGEALSDSKLTYGSNHLDSRGGHNDMYKMELINVLSMVEESDGLTTLLEALEASHSIHEMPLPFVALERSHVLSGASNIEHSLAKKISRSKLKSLYHLMPRRTIVKLLRMQLGSGLAGAAVNLFMKKPFGQRSLMQRMACAMLGVSDSEASAQNIRRTFSPVVAARLDHLIAFVEEADIDIFEYGDSEILAFLDDQGVSKRFHSESVPADEIEKMRVQRDAFLSNMQEIDLKSETSILGEDSDDEGESEDDEDVQVDLDHLYLQAADKEPEVKMSFFKRKSKNKDATNPLFDIRSYVQNKLDCQAGEMIVDLIGDEAIENFVRITLPIIQQHMISSVTSQGSGAIELVEGLFDAWKQIIKIHKKKEMSLAVKREKLRDVVTQVHTLMFTLFHTLLRSDKDNKWHSILYWLVDIWHGSKLNVDMSEMLQTLPKNISEKIAVESESIRMYFTTNANRSLGSERVDPPRVDATKELISLFQSRIVDGLFAPSKSKAVFDHVLPKRLQVLKVPTDSPGFLSNVEVTYAYEDTTLLVNRGYEMLNVDFGVDASTVSQLWVRRSTYEYGVSLDGTPLGWMDPITDIRIVSNTDSGAVDHLITIGYTKIAKALDKRNKHMWYKRNPNDIPIDNVTAIYMEQTNTKTDLKALTSLGYVLLPPILRPSPKNLLASFSSAFSTDKKPVGLYLKTSTSFKTPC